ncbi:hypothetical protein A6V25_18965 [Nostoc sp. ATCC 53789]|nr:hypothetical protein A6V25_18965 [Nostoc sp. ATCC 53789]
MYRLMKNYTLAIALCATELAENTKNIQPIEKQFIDLQKAEGIKALILHFLKMIFCFLAYYYSDF